MDTTELIHTPTMRSLEDNLRAAPPDHATTKDMAANATAAEHKMSLLDGIRTYPKAMGWSVLMSASIIMEGFDHVLTGQLYALPQFKRKFGVQQPNGTYEVPAPWQAGLSNGVILGSLIGILIASWAANRFGYRKTMAAELCLTMSAVFIYFFAQNIQTLMVAAVLMGIPFGGYETLVSVMLSRHLQCSLTFSSQTTSFASEVMPAGLRSYMTSYVNLCWVIGQMTASGTLRAVLGVPSELAFRIPYALQWAWPVPIFIGMFFMPESPYWLVRHGRIEKAREALIRLTSVRKHAHFNADEAIAMMKRTIELEEAEAKETTEGA